MGTPNFASPSNASEYFVVGTGYDEKYKECDECSHEHTEHDYDLDKLTVCESCGSEELEEKERHQVSDEFDWDNIKDNLNTDLEELEGNGISTKDGRVTSSSNSYSINPLLCLYKSKSYGEVNFTVEVTTVMQSAYYEGATLDWLVKIVTNDAEFDYMTGSHYDVDIYDILEQEFNPDYVDMNAGLCSIFKGYAERWIENTVSEISEKIEKVFKIHSEHRLHCAGVFSNGEAVYTAVKP
jgi:hypothetical protein